MYIFDIKITYIIILIYLLLTITTAYSQSYLIHVYNEHDGLANSTVYDIVQDTTGRMWFATRTGISVYDGSQWKSYTTRDNLPTDCYSKIKIDEKGILWALPLAPNLQLSCFINNEWITFPKADDTADVFNFSSLKIMYINDKLVIFVGTDNSGIYKLSENQWEQISIKQGLISNNINGMAIKGNRLYVATDKGISIINGTFRNP